jgi:hypothetical protein
MDPRAILLTKPGSPKPPVSCHPVFNKICGIGDLLMLKLDTGVPGPEANIVTFGGSP